MKRKQQKRKARKAVAIKRRKNTHLLSDAVRAAIEDERDTLMRAESLLRCAQIAHEYHDQEDLKGPYFPDVLAAIAELVGTVLNNLDSPLFDQRVDAIALGSDSGT